MFLVAVTGGIGSGKSTVSKIFYRLGCQIIDADEIAREVVDVGKPAWQWIRKHFGSEVFHEDGTLNREKLGSIVFSDGSKRKLLNSITHPEINKTIARRLLLHFLKGEQFVVLDLPLLFESGAMVPYMNTIIVVYSNKELQVSRLQSRNGYTAREAELRINAQMSLDEKRSRATCVIDNNGSLEQLENQVINIHDQLRRSKAHWKVRGAAICVLATLTWIAWKSIVYFFRVQ